MKRLLLILCSTSLLFSDNLEILNDTKQEIQKLKKEQLEQREQVNKYNWLSDININTSVTKDNNDIQREDYSLSFSQDIYRFGGIKSQMEYAQELKKLEQLNLDLTTKTDIYSIFTLINEIKINEIEIKKNILNLKNSQINVNHKKSEYTAGEIGISDLNEAIMTRNTLRENQKTLEHVKYRNIIALKQYTDKNFNSINLPNMSLISKELFLEKAINLKIASKNKKVSELQYEIKKTDYLPKVNLNGRYGYQSADNTNDGDYYNYGLSLSIPLSYTSKNDIEQNRLEYIISKKQLDKQKNDIEIFYDTILSSIKNYKEKIYLAKEDIKLYEELLSLNKVEYEAGYKTIDDVISLDNSKKIKELDIKLYHLNIQKEHINIYSNIL